jgi:hypothetical protein
MRSAYPVATRDSPAIDRRSFLGRAAAFGLDAGAQVVGSYRLTYGQIALAQLHLAAGEAADALAAADTALALAEANRLRLAEARAALSAA